MALWLPINRWLAIDLRGLRTVHLRTVIRWHSFDPCFTHDGFTPKGYGRGWNNVNNLLPGPGTYRLTHPGDTRVSFARNITSSCQGSSIRTVTQLEMLGQSNILSQKWNIVYNELSFIWLSFVDNASSCLWLYCANSSRKRWWNICVIYLLIR